MRSALRAFLLTVLLCGAARGEEITLVTEGFPPYNFEEPGGRVTGFSTELVRNICKQTRDCGNINLLSWNRAYAMAQTQANHALFSVYRRPERENSFKWVGPLTKAKVVFFARQDSPLKIDSLDDARKVKTIGVQRNSVHHLYLQSQGFHNLDVTASTDKDIGNTNLHMLLAGRFDLWMATETSTYDKAKRMGIDPLAIRPVFTLFTEDLYIAFNPATPDAVIVRWQTALDEIRKTPTYNELVRQFMQ